MPRLPRHTDHSPDLWTCLLPKPHFVIAFLPRPHWVSIAGGNAGGCGCQVPSPARWVLNMPRRLASPKCRCLQVLLLATLLWKKEVTLAGCFQTRSLRVTMRLWPHVSILQQLLLPQMLCLLLLPISNLRKLLFMLLLMLTLTRITTPMPMPMPNRLAAVLAKTVRLASLVVLSWIHCGRCGKHFCED
mmetsp:Transcript_110395/g.297358  ORF Transcript_110395/g.297358 Transcript_110395/m.297358 type:complete len:188 (+) Transcript_110395:1380-1943(+)